MNSVRVKAWQVEPGDRILGTDLIVIGHRYAGTGDIGSTAERQHYAVVCEGGAEVPYDADGWLTVLREEQ